MLEEELLTNTKQKFKYIMGHNKKEVRPGVNAEEEKFIKNISRRIIVPSERIYDCQDGALALHQKADEFGDYL